MTIFEIIVKVNGTDYYLDTDGVDPISLQYSISDVNDISSRNASFSKTITLPETKNNREVFGFISDLNSDGTLFNPNKRSKAYILVDSVVVMEGFLQLKKVTPNYNTNATRYECVIYADNYTFFNLIANKFLTDIDFSEYDHTYSTQSIINSWTADSSNGYFYPLLDSGYDWQYNDINGVKSQLVVRSFVPATYVKTIVDKMFTSAGFTYQSDFFNSEKFNNLLIPFNQNTVPTQKKFIYDNSFAVGRTMSGSYSAVFFSVSDNSLNNIRFSNSIPFNSKTDPYSDPLNAYTIGRTFGLHPAGDTFTNSFYWENKTGLNLSTGFVIDLDMDFEWSPYNGNQGEITLHTPGGFQSGNDYQDYLMMYRNKHPQYGWLDPDFMNEGFNADAASYDRYLFNILGNGATATPLTVYDYNAGTGLPPLLISTSVIVGPHSQIVIGGASQLTFIVEYSNDPNVGNPGHPVATTWAQATILRTDGTTASSITTTGNIDFYDEFYIYAPEYTVDYKYVRVRITSYTSGSLFGYFQSTNGIPPRYACPIFQSSTKLNLWGGQAIISQNGTYTRNGYTNTNRNVRLTRYTTDLLNNRGPSASTSATFSNSDYIYARPGEKFKLHLNRVFVGKNKNTPVILATASVVTTIGTASYIALNIDQAAFPGVPIDYNGVIPKKIKQSDFMLSLMRMFNLYFEPSKEIPNCLKIEPREDYYLNGEIKDWTRKVDISQEISEQIIAETQNKYTNFLYKKDTDWYNEDYTSKTNNVYGEYDYIMDNDFIKGEKKIELIFSPTPISNVRDAYGIIVPKIIKVQTNQRTGDGLAQHYDFNIRILSKNVNGLISAGGNKIKFEGVEYTNYPYIGHLDHPITPSYDLNFGEITSIYDGGAFGWDHYLIGMPSDNLFNTYYSKMLDEYSNPSSKIVSLNMYLTPIDIHNFRFNDSIFLDIQGQGQYYKVMKIDGYDPTSNGKTVKVDLLKTIYTNVPKNVNADDGSSSDSDLVEFGGTTFGNGTPIYVPPYIPISSGLMTSNTNTSRDRDTLLIGSNNSIGKPGIGVGQGNVISSENAFVSGNSNKVTDSKNASIVGSNNDVKFSSGISILGDSNIAQSGSKGLIIGSTNSITTNGKSIIFGDYNTASQATKQSFIVGDRNIISSQVISGTGATSLGFDDRDGHAFIFGSDNNIGTSSTNIVFGSNNTIPGGVCNSYILGSGIIASQSNTIYIGGTDSNVVISGSVSNASTFIDVNQIAFGTGTGITSSVSLTFDNINYNLNGSYGSSIIGSSQYSSIIGGYSNTLESSNNSAILSSTNTSLTQSGFSVVVGGLEHSMNSYQSSIVGGRGNRIRNSNFSSISGGYVTKIYESNYSSILGGYNSRIDSNPCSSIINGYSSCVSIIPNGSSGNMISRGNNIIGSKNSQVVVNGYAAYNQFLLYSNVIGGVNNCIGVNVTEIAQDSFSINNNIIGSRNSQIGIYSPDSGGVFLTQVYNSTIISSSQSSIGGVVDGGVILGGVNNNLTTGGFIAGVSMNNSMILGGSNNMICRSSYSSLINSIGSISTSNRSTIIGSENADIGGYSNGSIIIGGFCNGLCNSSYSTIISGFNNHMATASSYSSILGGLGNSIIDNSQYSSIIGGVNNIISHSDCSSIISSRGATVSFMGASSIIASSNKFLDPSIGRNSDSTLLTHLFVSGSMSTINGATYSVGWNGSTTISGTTLTIVNGLIVNVSFI